MRFSVVGLMAVISGLGYWSIAQAEGTEISMCVKQSGASYVIGTGFQNQSCKNNEQLLSFNVQGLTGPQGVQGPIGPQGPEGASVKLYDANDEIIGYYYPLLTGTGNSVFYSTKFKAFGSYSPDLIFRPWLPTESRDLYYKTTNCTGQAYVNKNEVDSVYNYSFFDNTNHGGDIYVPNLNNTEEDMEAASVKHWRDETCSLNENTTIDAYKADNIQNDLELYIKPFHISL